MSEVDVDPGPDGPPPDAVPAWWDELPTPFGAHYDKHGRPLSMHAYFDLRGRADYFRIGLSRAGEFNEIKISTVWLGLDHGFNPHALAIFETMVFGPGDDSAIIARYATLRQAQIGHRRIARVVRRQAVTAAAVKRRAARG